MPIKKNMDFFYDEQIRKYIIQMIRMFSNFHIQHNTNNGPALKRVPAKYALTNRIVGSLINNGSENTVVSAPQITIWLQDIKIARDRAQDPFGESKARVTEREWDDVNNQYTDQPGNSYDVDRYMPVPYDLTFKVDVWTTNTEEKLQLLEQFMVLFNPSIQIQINDNGLDWGNVSEVELTDINWSSRSVPVGSDDQMDIASLTFDVSAWISAPAKVKRQKMIDTIIANSYTFSDIDNLDYNPDTYDFFGAYEPTATVIVTGDDLAVDLFEENGTVHARLLQYGEPEDWNELIALYGELLVDSRIEFNLTHDVANLDTLLIGSSLSVHQSDPSVMTVDLDEDTLPSNTLDNVDRIIDPRSVAPGSGLPSAVSGQRYLCMEDMTENENTYTVWNVLCVAGNIIEFDGTDWHVVFSGGPNEAFVENDYTGDQFKWAGTEWISSYLGEYRAGYWRLILQ